MKTANFLRLKLIDLVGGLQIYDVFQMLKKHQYLPKEELDKIRQYKLAKLFADAKQSTFHYAPFNSFSELPVLTKKIINKNPAHFLSTFYQGKLIKKSTSGSTGSPFIYYSSAEAQSHLWAGLLLSWESTGYRFGDKVAFVAGSALIKSGRKHQLFYRLFNLEQYPAGIMTDETIARYIESMRSKKIKLICGYAMAINIIADYMIREKITPLQGLHGIVCTAEMLTEKIRANIEKAFGVKVFNQYGCNEAGIAAFECEHHNLHLISSRSVYEIDAEGRLIGTDLANKACIFMKFNTGDIVEFSQEVCTCGRHYPVIEKIIGRSDELITDKSNKKIHSSYFNFLFKKDKSIMQYQVCFDEKSIQLNLKVDQDFSEKNYHHYMNLLKTDFDFEVYEIKINEKFYSGSNAKHAFIIDKRKQQLVAA